MKFYCAECWEEIGNCAPWCDEAMREKNQGAVQIPAPEDAESDMTHKALTKKPRKAK